jgi:hypothetical protein
MPNPLSDIKRKTLERRLAALGEEYEAASAQLDRALSDVERLRIQREIEQATVSPTGLRTAMRTVYNLAELKILCDDLAVDYENLGGERLENRILELISFMRRRGRYEELVRKVLADRPAIAAEL